MVLSLATAAFAVEVTYEGKVGVKLSGDSEGDVKNDPSFDKDPLEAKITVDFTKDYGDGVTAGVKTKVEAHGDAYKDQDAGEDGNGIFDPEDVKKEFVFDGAGWIQVERDLFTVKAATKLNDQVGRDLKEYKIEEKAGLDLKLTAIDGLTVTTVLNNGTYLNYVVKGEYADDLFTVGGGFQSSEDIKQAFGVYGTLNLIDGLVINGEFGSRDDNTEDKEDAGTAIFATAAYDLDALSTKAGFLMLDRVAFGPSADKDDLDNENWRINELLRTNEADPTATPDFMISGANFTVLFADAAYQLTDEFEVNGYFDYLLSVKDADDKKVDKLDDVMSYKVGASYTFDDLKFEGWFKGFVGTQFGGKATYTLAEDVDTSFEVTSTKASEEAKDSKLAYTAKIVATL
jgi:hypothetical protein